MSNFERTSLVPLSRRGRLAGVGALSIALVAAAGVYGHARTQADEPYEKPIPAGTAYVGLFKDNAVAVVDTVSKGVAATIPVPVGPHGLVITPDGMKVYVSSDGDATVSVINTATNQITKTIDVGPTPHGLTISPDGSRVLVSGFGSNQFEVIDTNADEVVGKVAIQQPHNSAISSDGRTAYVGSQQQGATSIVEVDMATMSSVGVIGVQNAPRALNVSPDGRQLFFTIAGSDTIQVLDTARNQLRDAIPVGASPHQPIFSADGNLALVESQGPGELDLVNPMTDSVSGVVKVGTAPHWAAISGDGRRAYVTNEASNDLSVVDLSTGTVAATIPVGNGPRKIALQPGSSAASMSSMAMPNDQMGEHQTADQALTSQGMVDVRGSDPLEVEADDYYFSPADIHGVPGQMLTIEVSNESRTLHNFSIPEQGIDQDIRPGAKIDVTVTFPTSGALEYFCKFHKALGMTGRLVVDN
jgi:YVTN family beta-propeller protein